MSKTPKPQWTVLDVLFVFMVSITVLLLAIWAVFNIAGQQRIDQLPSWLTAIANQLWIFLTTAGASTLLWYIRGRSTEARPHYMGWILGTTLFIFLLMLGIQVAFVPPPPPPVNTAKLRLRLIEEFDCTNLAFAQRAPLPKDQFIISRQTDSCFVVDIDLPTAGQSFIAKTNPIVYSAMAVENPPQPSEICFMRVSDCKLSKPVITIEKRSGRFLASKPTDCEIQLCSGLGQETLQPNVFRFAGSFQENKLKWIVPSLETLQSSKKSGFTVFDVRLPDLKQKYPGANAYTATIFVNGMELLFNGFSSSDLRTALKDRNLAMQFGLENLNFSGHNSGEETIECVIRLFNGEKELGSEKLTFRYIAIRSYPEQRGVTTNKLKFSWSAKYIWSSAKEYEVFVNSAPSMEQALALKQKIDGLNLEINGGVVRAVVRPPLKSNPNVVGLALGIQNKSKQIVFTFPEPDAKKLLTWSKNAQPAKKFNSPFLYELEQR